MPSLNQDDTGSGAFTVTAIAADATSGLTRIRFPTALSSPAATYDNLPGLSDGSWAKGYDFGAGDTFSGPVVVTAKDRVLNTQQAIFSLVNDEQAPTVTLDVPDTGSPVLSLAWSGDDGAGADVAGYELEYKAGSGPWSGWLPATVETGGTFVGQPGYICGLVGADLRRLEQNLWGGSRPHF